MKFFTQMFSGNNSASYGRFASFLTLACVLIWVSLLVGKVCSLQTCTIADVRASLPDIPANWFFLICVPFAISKAGETVVAVATKGAPDAAIPKDPANQN